MNCTSGTARGWIKLHRRLWENPRSHDPEWLAVWVYLLSHATHQPWRTDFDGKIVELKPGQLKTGRDSIAEATGVHPSKVRRLLAKMKCDQQIDQQAGVKGSIITVLNWESYQRADQQNDHQPTSDRPTSDQQATTNNNGKNKEKEKNKKNTQSDVSIPIPLSLQKPEFQDAWQQWQVHRNEVKRPMTPTSARAQLQKLEAMGPERAVATLNHSITCSYLAIVEPQNKTTQDRHERTQFKPLTDDDHKNGF